MKNFVLCLIVALTGAVSAQAEDPRRGERPAPALDDRMIVTGLGPTILPNGEKATIALRLQNPQPYTVSATVGGHRIDLDAYAIVELDTYVGTVMIRSDEPIGVTSHTVHPDAIGELDASVQVAARTLSALSNGVVAVTSNSVACRYGTSYAYVPPVEGATYVWTTSNTNVIEGAGTNLVKLAHTGAASASVSVAVTANGATSNGTASITLRDPYAISELFPSSSTITIGQPVTISWAIAGTDIPRSQSLKINGTAVAIKAADRSYTFTPASIGDYAVELVSSLVGGRRRSVRSGTSPIPAASFCGSATRTTSFRVSDVCTPASGSVSFSGSSLTVGQGTTVAITANGPWVASVTRGTLSKTSGNGNDVITFTSSNIGTATVTLTISSSCDSVTRTDTVTVTAPAPTANISASPTTVVRGGSGSTLTITVTNTTSWTISSSIGNVFNNTGGTGSGTFTRTYDPANARGTDTITLTATGPGGTVTDTVQIVVQ